MIFRNLTFFLLLFGIMLISFPGLAQSKKQKEAEQGWKYELEASGIATQGTYQVKVWSYTRDPEAVHELAMKNAVHGIIFKGFGDKERIKGQKPLSQSPNLEIEHAPYFAEFFKPGGKFLKFVSLVEQGAIAPGDRIQVGKEFKIGIVVTVQVQALRKELESAGIIKSLTSGF